MKRNIPNKRYWLRTSKLRPIAGVRSTIAIGMGILALANCIPQDQDATARNEADELAGVPSFPHERVCNGGTWSCNAHVRTNANHAIAATATPAGLTPADLISAYHLDASKQPKVTIAIVDAYNYPNAESDLANYRTQFSLPPCTQANGCLRIVNQNGAASPLPG